MAIKLTESFVKNLSRDQPTIAFDDTLPGFGVRVAPGGTVTFLINSRVGGKQRRLTIGQFPLWTATAARKRAAELRRDLDSGRDPVAERKAERAAPLMGEVLQRYLAEHAAIHKKPRSVLEDISLIHGGKKLEPREAFAGPIGRYFLNTPVAAVTRETMMKFQASLRDTPVRANAAVRLLSKAFNLAEVWRLRPEGSNPCRHLKKFPETPRQRSLSSDELQRLGDAMRRSNESPAVIAMIQALLLTGCRVGELVALRWDDVDLKAGVARLRDAKAGARTVQLSSAVQAVMAALPRDGATVFGLSYRQAFEAWHRLCADANIKGARLHDARHTTGTVAGAAGFNAFLVRDLLGHKTLAMTHRYVSQHTDPLRVVADAVGETIGAALAGRQADVIPLAKKQ